MQQRCLRTNFQVGCKLKLLKLDIAMANLSTIVSTIYFAIFFTLPKLVNGSPSSVPQDSNPEASECRRTLEEYGDGSETRPTKVEILLTSQLRKR